LGSGRSRIVRPLKPRSFLWALEKRATDQNPVNSQKAIFICNIYNTKRWLEKEWVEFLIFG
jgi:hypothetical protein